MHYQATAFHNDLLTLTWNDLWSLALGRILQAGALIIRRGHG